MRESIALGAFVFVLGSLVTIGWTVNMQVLKSIHESFVSMKLATSVGFMFMGVGLCMNAVVRRTASIVAESIRTFCCVGILVCMVPVMVESTTGGVAAIERVYGHKDLMTQTISPGRPSVGSMVVFVSIAISMLLPGGSTSHIAGLVIGFFSTMAILGYLYSVPFLYWYVPGYSTGMAIHTCIGVFAASLSLVLSGWDGVSWESFGRNLILRK